MIRISRSHAEMLQASAISIEVIRAESITTVDQKEAAIVLRRKSCPSGGIEFGYVALDGTPLFSRVALDQPLIGDDGAVQAKYLSPVGCTQCIYVPKTTMRLMRETVKPLIITEGEKKSLAIVSAGWPAVALPGVNGVGKKANEQGKRDPNFPALANLGVAGRDCFIIFDSDAATNPQVAAAEDSLFVDLLGHQAKPRVVRLPPAPDGGKQGIDDWLARTGENGPAEFEKLLQEAKAEPMIDVVGEGDRKRAPSQLEVARAFLDGERDTTGRPTIWRHNGEFWRFDLNCYRRLSDDDVRRMVFDCMETMLPEKQRSHKTCDAITGIVKLLVHIDSKRNAPFFISDIANGPNRDTIALSNQLLNIPALLRGDPNYLSDTTPDWFSTVALTFEFNPAADCPRWKRFLAEVLERDTDLIETLQMFFGYCLTADHSQQKALVLVGLGSNGKSIVLQIGAAVLGEDNVSSVPLQCFAQRFALSSTIGKLANIVAECSELDKNAEATIKSFVTADWMTIDKKNKDPVQVRPTAKLIVGTNSVPRFADKTRGIWRRILLIPFNVQITEERQDKGLLEKLREELPGIFLWALVGLYKLRTKGRFPAPKISEQMLNDCRLESNPILRFFNDHVYECVGKRIQTDKLYEFYKWWCNAYGYRAMSQGSFGTQLAQHFTFERVRGGGGTRPYFYEGLDAIPHARFPI